MSQLELTYVQATLRYAAFLDKKVSEGKLRDELYDDQGEGLTFWRVIEPRVARRDAAAAQLISARYDLANDPTQSDFYCVVLSKLVALNANRAAGVSAAQIGTLRDVYDGLRAASPLAYYQCSAFTPRSSPSAEFRLVAEMADIMVLLGEAVASDDWLPVVEAYVASGLRTLARADYDGEIQHDLYEVRRSQRCPTPAPPSPLLASR
jgi:hypothetical protein